jgi:uncharacterized membrane protein YdjX (TVP38/TMEM64 family)
VGGVLLVLGLGLAHAVVWYPAEILITATGFIYGFWAGLPLLMLAWLINGLVCFYVGRHGRRSCDSSAASGSCGTSAWSRAAARRC